MPIHARYASDVLAIYISQDDLTKMLKSGYTVAPYKDTDGYSDSAFIVIWPNPVLLETVRHLRQADHKTQLDLAETFRKIASEHGARKRKVYHRGKKSD